MDDGESDLNGHRVGVIGGARAAQASTLNPARGGVTFPTSGVQTRSSSFSGIESKSPRTNTPLPSHLEEALSYSAFQPSSPYPTFSEQSSPSSSPPMPNSNMFNHLSRSPPRAELNVSRSRSQSLATSGIRPTLGSGLIPLPMSSLAPSGGAGHHGRQLENPWSNSPSGPDRLVMHPAAPDLSNSSPFARDIQSIINDETARARERVASRIQAETEAFAERGGRYESSGAWPSRHAAAQQHLTSSIREAFGSMHDFGPLPYDDGTNGGVSGTSSRRHSVSVVGGPNARRGFSVAGFGFTDSGVNVDRDHYGSSGNAFTKPSGKRQTGFSDDDLLAEGLETALNLHADAERRGQVTNRRTVSGEIDPSRSSVPIAMSGNSFRGRDTLPHDQFLAGDDRYSARESSLDARSSKQPESMASRDSSRFGFGLTDRGSRAGDAGALYNQSSNSERVPASLAPGIGKQSANYMASNFFAPPASTNPPPNPYRQTLPQHGHFADSSDRNHAGQPHRTAQGFGGAANARVPLSTQPNLRTSGFSDALADQYLGPSYSGPNLNNRMPMMPQMMSNGPPSVASPFNAAPSFIGSIGSGPGPANERTYAELGKGIPLTMVTPSTPLYIVEFKAGRTDLFYNHDPNLRIARGDLVVVEADRGQDLGKVTNDTITLDEVKAFQAQRQHELAQLTSGQGAMIKASGPLAGLEVGMGMMGGDGDGGPNSAIRTLSKEICPKRIFGKAGPADQQFLMAKLHDEAQALLLCQTKVKQKRLPMEVIDAEYQWDRRKLTFYFVAEKRIDFRELVKELFRMHKTRIWMASL